MTTDSLKLVSLGMSFLLCLNSVIVGGSSANTELFTTQKKIVNGRCKENLLVGNYFISFTYIYIYI